MEARVPKSPSLRSLEDLANSLSHAGGMGMGVAGTAILVVLASRGGDPWKIVSVSIFGACLVLLYTASSLYHVAHRPGVRKILRILDHMSIHLLIAGTYTPFVLVNLRGPLGWTVFGIVWGLAGAGMVADAFFTGRFKLLSTLLYLAMGWTMLAVLRPLAAALPPAGLVLLLSGGLAYSLGAAFYVLDKRLAFGHAVWHLFVLGGSVCHFLAILLGVLPHTG